MNTHSILKRIPNHLNDFEKTRFEAYPKLEFIQPRIREIQNAWLTYSGICFKPYKIYKESIYWKAYPAYKYFFQGLYNLIFKKKRLYEGLYVYIHTSWSVVNYYHWLADSLPRLFPLLLSIENLVLLLPEKAEHVEFIQDSLRLMGIQSIKYIKSEEINKVEKLLLVEVTPGNYCLSADFKPTINYLKNQIGFFSEKPFRKIYLTRRNMGYRKIENEEGVCELLSKYGFEVAETGAMSLSEQARLFSETKYMVAVHGAAITNCVFMAKDSSFLELHPTIENKDKIFHVSYWNLAEYFGLNYFFIGCEPIDQTERFHTANLKVDLVKLENLTKKMLSIP